MPKILCFQHSQNWGCLLSSWQRGSICPRISMLSVRLSPLHINDGLISAWPRHNHHILGWDQTLNSDPLSAAGSIQDITLNFYLLASAQNPQNHCKGTFAYIFGLWRFLFDIFLPDFAPVLPLLDNLKMLMPDVVDNFNPINYFKEYSIITRTIRMHCSEEKKYLYQLK